ARRTAPWRHLPDSMAVPILLGPRRGKCFAPITSGGKTCHAMWATRCVSRPCLAASFAFCGDYDAALPGSDAAMRLSPRDPFLTIWHLLKGWTALLSEHYREAV